MQLLESEPGRAACALPGPLLQYLLQRCLPALLNAKGFAGPCRTEPLLRAPAIQTCFPAQTSGCCEMGGHQGATLPQFCEPLRTVTNSVPRHSPAQCQHLPQSARRRRVLLPGLQVSFLKAVSVCARCSYLRTWFYSGRKNMKNTSHLRHSGVQSLLFSTHCYSKHLAIHIICCLHISFKYNIQKLQSN